MLRSYFPFNFKIPMPLFAPVRPCQRVKHNSLGSTVDLVANSDRITIVSIPDSVSRVFISVEY